MFDASTNVDAGMPEPAPQRRVTGADARRFFGWTFVGIGIGLALVLIGLRQANYDPTPTLTPQLFEAAHQRWKSKPLANYDIEIKVTGPQASTYRVEVRDGEPRAAWRNGQPLTSHRTFGTWSVPGMFATMSRDVESVEQAASANRPTPLILRASFNADFGYPEHYRRIDNGSRKGSDAIAVTWNVTEFRVVE